MKYLDYLLTHTYAELPPEVSEGISEKEYSDRRAYARGMVAAAPTELPPALRQAYRSTIAKNGRPAGAVYWMAAAGWLLAIAIFFLILNRDPHVAYVTRYPAPIIERDTVEVIRRDTFERVVYRTRLLHDTFFAPAAPPRLLVLRDTVYVEAPTAYPTGTATLDRATLSLLVGSRAE